MVLPTPASPVITPIVGERLRGSVISRINERHRLTFFVSMTGWPSGRWSSARGLVVMRLLAYFALPRALPCVPGNRLVPSRQAAPARIGLAACALRAVASVARALREMAQARW